MGRGMATPTRFISNSKLSRIATLMGEGVFEWIVSAEDPNLGSQLSYVLVVRHQLPVAFGLDIGSSPACIRGF